MTSDEHNLLHLGAMDKYGLDSGQVEEALSEA